MSVETDLHTEPVAHLDLSEYTLVESGTSVRDAIQKMRFDKRNCAFITQKGKLTGIFTDRDVLRRVVDRPDLWDHPIEEVMTHHPKAINSEQPTGDALRIMNDLHFRNTPVLGDDGTIAGNLTHFSIIRYLADHFPEAVYNLPPQPDLYAEEREGG
ncbi:MAG TPA: CBS domain-containing protein [Anaerolineales bacterium]|nr:CBS domain-containing protein [Anaerolineales bacterium]